MQYHFIIHHQNACTKKIKFDHVMKEIIKVVNFIRFLGLNHREFQKFLSDIDAEHEDVAYLSDVRWLSRRKMLKRVFDLKEAIKTFLASKQKPTALFDDKEWLNNFGFLTDLTMHLNELNGRLQENAASEKRFDALPKPVNL